MTDGKTPKIDFGSLDILVVDDSQLMQELLCAVLKAFGFRKVVMRATAEEALQELKAEPFDAVITDWEMDEMSGLDFTKKIRHEFPDPVRRIPVIICTGHTERSRVVAAVNAGVNQFLSKPVTAEAIYDKIIATFNDDRPFVVTKQYVGPSRRSPDRDRQEAIDLDDIA